MAFGESKAGAMQQAIDRRHSALPVALVLRRAGRSVMLVAEAAASDGPVPALNGSALGLLGESSDVCHDRTQPGPPGFRG
jgi:hypothetical protein